MGSVIRPILSWTCKSCSCKLLVPSGTRKSRIFYSTWSNSRMTLRDRKGALLPMTAYHQRSFSASTSTSTNVELDYKAYFNEEEVEKILKTVNNIPDLEDLQKFGFSKKAIKVLKVKKQEGDKNKDGKEVAENIDDLVAILGVTSSLRAFGYILDRPNLNLKNPMFPVPTEDIVQKSESVVSIVIHGSQISWCCIKRSVDNKFHLEQLHFQNLEFKSKQHFLSGLNEMVGLCQRIPKSQLCIIQEFTTAVNPSMFSYLLQMTQLRSFLLGILAARLELAHIIAIKTVAVARLFNTVVGTERVSGQHLVDNMITWKPLPSLIVPNRLKEDYENLPILIKEGLANSFLLNLAYWRLTKQFKDSFL